MDSYFKPKLSGAGACAAPSEGKPILLAIRRVKPQKKSSGILTGIAWDFMGFNHQIKGDLMGYIINLKYMGVPENGDTQRIVIESLI